MNGGRGRGHSHSLASILLLLLLVSPRCTSAFSAPRFSTASLPSRRPIRSAVAGKKAGRTKNSWSNRHVRSTSTTLSAMQVPLTIAAAGSTVVKFYKTFPIVAGFLTASTKAAFADSVAQRRDSCVTKFDVKRNLSMMLYSGLVLGVSCEVMYNDIFPLIFGTVPDKCVYRAIKMTLFDGFVNAPLLWLPPAYIVKAWMYGHPKREAIRKYVVDVKENGLLKKYWSLWLPLSMVNFMFVPAHFRIAFVAAISFFWMIILSLVANNDQDTGGCRV